MCPIFRLSFFFQSSKQLFPVWQIASEGDSRLRFEVFLEFVWFNSSSIDQIIFPRAETVKSISRKLIYFDSLSNICSPM